MSQRRYWFAYGGKHRFLCSSDIMCINAALWGEFERTLVCRKVRRHMPVRDILESPAHAVQFLRRNWDRPFSAQQHVRPAPGGFTLMFVGGGNHFTLLLLHRKKNACAENGTVRVTTFDPMTPMDAKDTQVELDIEQFCKEMRQVQFYKTRCHWQLDGVHCGMYMLLATHALMIQYACTGSLGGKWDPQRYGRARPLCLLPGRSNEKHVREVLRLFYADLVDAHWERVRNEVPLDAQNVVGPFPCRLCRRRTVDTRDEFCTLDCRSRWQVAEDERQTTRNAHKSSGESAGNAIVLH